jgi:hypothetical protein
VFLLVTTLKMVAKSYGYSDNGLVKELIINALKRNQFDDTYFNQTVKDLAAQARVVIPTNAVQPYRIYFSQV